MGPALVDLWWGQPQFVRLSVAGAARSPNQGNRLATHSQNFATPDLREPAHHNDPPVDDDAGKFSCQI